VALAPDRRQSLIRNRLQASENAYADVARGEILLQGQRTREGTVLRHDGGKSILKNYLARKARRNVTVVGVQQQIHAAFLQRFKRSIMERDEIECDLAGARQDRPRQ